MSNKKLIVPAKVYEACPTDFTNVQKNYLSRLGLYHMEATLEDLCVLKLKYPAIYYSTNMNTYFL